MAAAAQRARGLRFAASAAALALTSACTSLAPLPPSAAESAPLSGRLAIRVEASPGGDARSFSAAFDLRGSAGDGSLGLSTPLGSVLARARWQPGEVSLATPQETRRFADLDALTREVLGESVPVEAWFDWLQGRPWPGAPSTARPLATNSAAAGFEQLGWAVDLSRLGDGRVVAVRERPAPAVTVRIQLDRS